MDLAKKEFVCLSSNVVVNGNPVRESFLNPPSRLDAAFQFGLRADLPTLLITGGSQGAKAINDALIEALRGLLRGRPQLQILHQVGEKNFETYRSQLSHEVLNDPRYCLRSYIDDLAVAYAVSDLSLCRAGAMTLSEIATSGVPAILVPYPFAAQNHQMHNARYMEGMGCAVVIAQNELNAQNLSECVFSLISNQSKLTSMRQAMRAIAKPNAAKDISHQLKEIGFQLAVCSQPGDRM
jgi:UDP-N-acetylglucosamine--N-acetylmuramyl-(pentapeptide) pyrophosphoryl-undecaprenol N-acetylglucosamine transferase